MNIIQRKEKKENTMDEICNLAQIRKARHITQQQLSYDLGVDRSTIAKWESGAAMPRANKLPGLAKSLNCDISELFEAKNSHKDIT